jgi:hypothetical protein
MGKIFIVKHDDNGQVEWQREVDIAFDQNLFKGEILPVQKTADQAYEVLSSKKDHWYRVSTAGSGTCDCPAFKFRGGQGCKHLDQVRIVEKQNTQPMRQNALRFIENNPDIDAVTADDLFGEQLMKQMIVEGEIYEVKGRYRITR